MIKVADVVLFSSSLTNFHGLRHDKIHVMKTKVLQFLSTFSISKKNILSTCTCSWHGQDYWTASFAGNQSLQRTLREALHRDALSASPLTLHVAVWFQKKNISYTPDSKMAAILVFFCLLAISPCYLIQGKIFFWILSLRIRQQRLICKKTKQY